MARVPNQHLSVKEKDVTGHYLTKAETRLLGQRFGRLRVTAFAGRVKRISGWKYHWECLCDCGKTSIVESYRLTSGVTKSCGCLSRELIGNRQRTHGCQPYLLHRVWAAMLRRCRSSKDIGYHNYGGRGIQVCNEWRQFVAFRDWALNNGWRHGLQIDRIDVNGNYCPGNCRFVTGAEQQLYTRQNYRITYKGKTMCLTEWERELGIRPSIFISRHSQGWSDERILTQTVRRTSSRPAIRLLSHDIQ